VDSEVEGYDVKKHEPTLSIQERMVLRHRDCQENSIRNLNTISPHFRELLTYYQISRPVVTKDRDSGGMEH
jgi:hypothetical protein